MNSAQNHCAEFLIFAHMRILLVITFCLGAFVNSFAQSFTYDFNDRCEEAYQAIMQLRLQKGMALLEAEKKAHPHNLIPYLLENYADFFELFFNEDPRQFAAKKHARLQRLELLIKGPKNDPYYFYSQAVIRFQWALIRVKFGEKWDAAWDIRKAYFLLKDNQKKYPQFEPNQMLLGPMLAVFGTIPDGMKWVSNILGLKGNLQQGMQLLEKVLYNSSPTALQYRDESTYYYCYLKFFLENNPTALWKFMDQRQLNTKDNYLFALMVANLSLNNQKAEQGIAVLTQRNYESEFSFLHYHNYLLGLMKLERQDADAIFYLEKFVTQFKGRFYVKEALQRLSWAYFLKGDTKKATYYRQQILIRGNVETDADKQAQKEAERNFWPNSYLLKARLLSDGGYYAEANKMLQERTIEQFETIADQLEYTYRKARILDELNQKDAAISHYKKTIQMGTGRPEYFAARAALQLGFIYEARKQYDLAKQSFQNCLSMKGHD
jgi:tetratricopeptide (TPR) repeat protein